MARWRRSASICARPARGARVAGRAPARGGRARRRLRTAPPAQRLGLRQPLRDHQVAHADVLAARAAGSGFSFAAFRSTASASSPRPSSKSLRASSTTVGRAAEQAQSARTRSELRSSFMEPPLGGAHAWMRRTCASSCGVGRLLALEAQRVDGGDRHFLQHRGDERAQLGVGAAHRQVDAVGRTGRRCAARAGIRPAPGRGRRGARRRCRRLDLIGADRRTAGNRL